MAGARKRLVCIPLLLRLYLSPAIASPSVTISLTLNFILNLAWIFVWDRSTQTKSLLIVAFIILLLCAITNILAAAFLAKNIVDNQQHFVRGAALFWWGVVYRYVVTSCLQLHHDHLHQDHVEWAGHLHHLDDCCHPDKPDHSSHLCREGG